MSQTTRQNKVVVYAGTRNVYHHMAVAAKSLLIHSPIDRVIFLIEDDEFPEPIPSVIECVNVSDQKFFKPDSPNFTTRWTYMSLMRLALPLMFPEEDRMLWLDVDTIVEGDISKLFETDMADCYVAAVEEPTRSKNPFVYFNAGVLLLEMQKLRDGKCCEWIDYINRHKLSFSDQDCINLLCQGKIKKLEPIWNSCPWTEEPDDRVIVHFAADRDYSRQLLFIRYENAEWGNIHERDQSV